MNASVACETERDTTKKSVTTKTCDYWRDRQTDSQIDEKWTNTGQSDPYLLLCLALAGNTKSIIVFCNITDFHNYNIVFCNYLDLLMPYTCT